MEAPIGQGLTQSVLGIILQNTLRKYLLVIILALIAVVAAERAVTAVQALAPLLAPFVHAVFCAEVTWIPVSAEWAIYPVYAE